MLTPLVQAQIEARAQAKGTSVEEETLALLSEKQPSKQFVYPQVRRKAHIIVGTRSIALFSRHERHGVKQTQDIGELAAFLCSPAAAQITGAAISIDGGWTAI